MLLFYLHERDLVAELHMCRSELQFHYSSDRKLNFASLAFIRLAFYDNATCKKSDEIVEMQILLGAEIPFTQRHASLESNSFLRKPQKPLKSYLSLSIKGILALFAKNGKAETNHKKLFMENPYPPPSLQKQH